VTSAAGARRLCGSPVEARPEVGAMSVKRPSWKRLLVVVATGGLAVAGCSAGSQGVSSKEACAHGALFLCDNPVSLDQQ
jgi:hypothetical protein